jgi:hypothetical protein
MDIVWSCIFGQARVAVISEGTGWWPIERALEGVSEEHWRPLIEADREKRMPVGFNLVHLTLADHSICSIPAGVLGRDAILGRSCHRSASKRRLALKAVSPA